MGRRRQVADVANAARKQRGRPFPPGVSGNPYGKKPGTRHRATQLAEQLMNDDLEAVVQAVIKAARGGDIQAAKVILDRLAPIRRGRPVEIDLPEVRTADDVLAAQARIIDAVAGGNLTPEEGELVANVVEAKRKAIETLEHEERLAAIEERLEKEKNR